MCEVRRGVRLRGWAELRCIQYKSICMYINVGISGYVSYTIASREETKGLPWG